MIKDATVNGRIYQIDTTPDGYHYAEVLAVNETPASGALAEVLTEVTGKQMMSRTLTIPSDKEIKEVVLTLGWKFSRSKAWKDTFEHYYRRR